MYWENADFSNGDWILETWTWSWNLNEISLFAATSDVFHYSDEYFIFWENIVVRGRKVTEDTQAGVPHLFFLSDFQAIFLTTYLKISFFGQHWIQSVVRKIKMELISYLLHQNWNFRS